MVSTFQNRVYSIVRKIPKGKVMTYGELARKLKTSARAIGQALKRNVYKQVPCHRVVCSDGKIGGFYGASHTCIKHKIRMLRKEGITIKNNKII